jgi:hypothetical protein
MSDKYGDVLPIIAGALAGLLIYLSRRRRVAPSGAQELSVTVNESVSIMTDASIVIGAPSDVVINDSIDILTSANLSVTAPPSGGGGGGGGYAETNVIVDDSVSISTSANLSVA